VRGDLVQDFSPTHLEKSIEQSLRRLRTDRIDLFQLHSPPLAITSSDDWIDALVRLKQAGKIRYYGVSCDDPDAAFAALDKAGLSSIQVPLNLLERRSLGVIERAHQGDVAVIARECLANGLLVKALSPAEVRSFCETDDEAEHKSIRIQEYRREATQTGRSLVQMALNYVTSLPGVSVTLIGVSRLQQLESLLSELPATSNSDRRASSLA
jgi:aryl-alcohol dehydrogenase-like predicted oxidoreductase